jgi:hypothetical protein
VAPATLRPTELAEERKAETPARRKSGGRFCFGLLGQLQRMRWRLAFWCILTQTSGCFGNCACGAPPVTRKVSDDAGGVGGLTTSGGGGSGRGFAFGGGGTGAGPDVFPKSTRLGRACATDAECGDGLTCVKADSGMFDGEGPAKGMCTTDCSNDGEVCAQFRGANAPAPICVPLQSGMSFCFEGCEPSAGELAVDPNKCHGRPEMACAGIGSGEGWLSVCVPQCNADSDCGGGIFCNPRTGGCSTTQVTGAPVGSACAAPNGDAGPSECRGSCQAVMQGDVGPFTYACTERCTIGIGMGCGWQGLGSSVAPGACLLLLAGVELPFAHGNLGACAQLCDDDCDCSNPDLVCNAWTGAQAQANKDYYQRNGFCIAPLPEDGGASTGITCGSDSGSD